MMYLLWSGLIIYSVNYAIGWLLHLKLITMKKRTHQIFYSAIIVNLVVLMFFVKFLSAEFFLNSASLGMMLILPLGKKGGVYHRIVSTAGLVLYLVLFAYNTGKGSFLFS